MLSLTIAACAALILAGLVGAHDLLFVFYQISHGH